MTKTTPRLARSTLWYVATLTLATRKRMLPFATTPSVPSMKPCPCITFIFLCKKYFRANEKGVDFMIHGGDLFHEHKPSKETLIKTGEILTRHVLGTRDFRYKVAKTADVNVRDESVRVKLPIMIIHGNHDDPGGLENLSNIDIMRSTKLVNYMGKVDSLEKIDVQPLLFEKGRTRIALYGIGYVKDERLNLAFEKKLITFRRPEGEWFNILVLHQTKERGAAVGTNKRAFLRERTLPEFFHLVLWGHEHECIPVPQKCEHTGSYVLYMGSTVVTSLIDSEAKPKHCFVVDVLDKKFRVTPIRLKAARPLVYGQIELSQCGIKTGDDAEVEKCIEERINALLTKLEQERENEEEEEEGKEKLIPLLRLKVEYTGYPVISTRALGKRLEGRVANWQKDFIKFYKKPAPQLARGDKRGKKIDDKVMGMLSNPEIVKEIDDPSKAQLDFIVLFFYIKDQLD
eukprot:TRINITY_DN108915_c0_g1_i1.p2 TRINITY_DN108915_c0_g1~~TRINITY_DN108915_c0_g1_i1.p2  ORF type:complete len:483 (+),score=44.19 TRINITY_DN108915_c0_g1_i1:77-1450(+)